ncbi:MAG: hypothetical protein Q7S18_01650 [bacterium]|nr:hypothetical protein [bacterium]
MEENEKEGQDNDTVEDANINSWFRDNLRIIVSIIIVVAIAGGVYSYSKKNQVPAEKKSATESAEEGAIETQKGEEETTANKQQEPTDQKKEISKTAISQETEGSFIEAAGKGEGKTHLARRALANYLEKNPDSTLTPEHKIYIEDSLRKHSGFNGKVRVGTSIEFSKDSISKTIESSKNLNDKQLKNLHKYALRVPSLT